MNPKKERETGLIVKRIEACRQIIDSSLSEFSRENTAYFFESRQKTTIRVVNMDKANRRMYSEYFEHGQFEQLMEECTQHIEYTLSNWDGVKSSKRIRKKMLSFRCYFIPSKNWFDQTKIGIMASYFWIPLFNLIDRVESPSEQFIVNLSAFIFRVKEWLQFVAELMMHNVSEMTMK